jgi:hypothetical protein
MMTEPMPKPAKTTDTVDVSARIKRETYDRLNELRESWRPQPSLSAIIALALEEWVEQQKGKRR